MFLPRVPLPYRSSGLQCNEEAKQKQEEEPASRTTTRCNRKVNEIEEPSSFCLLFKEQDSFMVSSLHPKCFEKRSLVTPANKDNQQHWGAGNKKNKNVARKRRLQATSRSELSKEALCIHEEIKSLSLGMSHTSTDVDDNKQEGQQKKEEEGSSGTVTFSCHSRDESLVSERKFGIKNCSSLLVSDNESGDCSKLAHGDYFIPQKKRSTKRRRSSLLRSMQFGDLTSLIPQAKKV